MKRDPGNSTTRERGGGPVLGVQGNLEKANDHSDRCNAEPPAAYTMRLPTRLVAGGTVASEPSTSREARLTLPLRRPGAFSSVVR